MTDYTAFWIGAFNILLGLVNLTVLMIHPSPISVAALVLTFVLGGMMIGDWGARESIKENSK